MKNKNHISTFALALCEAVSFDECFSVLTHSIQRMGFDGVLYTSIPLSLFSDDATQRPIFKVSEAYSAAFISHYSQAKFAECDFTIDRIAGGRLHTLDWWEEARRGAISEPEKDVIVVAREEYSIRNGLTIPTLSSGYEISGVSVISYERRPIYQSLLLEHLSSLECVAKLFHSRVHSDLSCRQVFIAPSLSVLSRREREVFKFLATGLPLKTISDHYAITPGYAKNIVAGLCQKMGVTNASRLRYMMGIYRMADLL